MKTVKVDRKRFWAFSLAVSLIFMTMSIFSFATLKVALAQEAVDVKHGFLPVISFAPNFVAMEKGFFKDEGLKVEFIRFASAGKMMAPLATGEVDVAAGSPSAGLFNAIATGQEYKVVADKGQVRKGYGYFHIVVRKDLIDSGKVKTVKDLKGMKIANAAKGIVRDYFLDKMAREVGLSIKDFEIVYLDDPKQSLALENKSIDAAITVEPWGARAVKRNIGIIFKKPDEVEATKDVQVAMIMYSGKFIKEKRQAAQKFMNAYVKGIRYYKEKGENDKEILDILVKYTGLDAETISSSIPFYLDDNAVPNVRSLSEFQDWLFENELVTKKVPMDQVLDLSFLKKN